MENDERAERADEIGIDFNEALRRKGIPECALLLSGPVIDAVFNSSRYTRGRLEKKGLLPAVRHGRSVRYSRRAVENLYRRLVAGTAA